MAKIITVAAIKGGTGKTATAGALTQAAAADGKKVLAIDLDPQSNLSIWMNADFTGPGSYELITGQAAPEDAIQETGGGIDLISGSANLIAVNRTEANSARRLERAIAPLHSYYDLIMIDTAPAMGELQNNALFASNGLLIPLESDINSLQGLYQITDIAQHTQQANPALQVLGVILTKYDPRPKINRFLRDTIKDKGAAAGAPLLMEIRQGVAIREAIAMRENLFEYAPNSKPAQDYKALYKLIMEA